MAGICGSTKKDFGLESLEEFLEVNSEETRNEFFSSNIQILNLFNQIEDESKIKDFEDYVVCLHGEIYSYRSSGEYSEIEEDSLDFLKDKFEEKSDFSRINGNFLALIYEKGSQELNLITDRLSTKPLFYLIEEGKITFSSKIQAFSTLEHYELDNDYLTEYICLGRVLGTKTPIEGVKQLPPASICSFKLGEDELRVNNYWTPEYDPQDKPFSHFKEKFQEYFAEALDERTREDVSYGLLLSGGFDSRLIAGMKDNITCYHMNEYMNKEAQAARKVAEKTGNEFVFLERGENYVPDMLEESARLNNFYGAFDQNHALGFVDELKDEDILLSGQYSDTLFEGTYIPRKEIKFGYNIKLPFADFPNSLDNYIERYTSEKEWLNISTGQPSYLRNTDISEVLKENIGEQNTINHDIKYENFRTLIEATEYFPITNRNTYLFQEGLSDISANRSILLDNRLIELQLKIPLKYKLRKSLVKSCLSSNNPELAKVPHPETRLSAHRSVYTTEASKYFFKLAEKIVSGSEEDAGAWTDHNKLVKNGKFENIIEENRETIEDIEIIYYKNLQSQYRQAEKGKVNYDVLYKAFTLLKMPIVRNR